MFLYFQLKTHNDVINEKYKEEGAEDDEEEEVPSLSVFGGFFMLGMITLVVAFMSEFLTGSIEEVRKLAPQPRASCLFTRQQADVQSLDSASLLLRVWCRSRTRSRGLTRASSA